MGSSGFLFIIHCLDGTTFFQRTVGITIAYKAYYRTRQSLILHANAIGILICWVCLSETACFDILSVQDPHCSIFGQLHPVVFFSFQKWTWGTLLFTILLGKCVDLGHSMKNIENKRIHCWLYRKYL